MLKWSWIQNQSICPQIFMTAHARRVSLTRQSETAARPGNAENAAGTRRGIRLRILGHLADGGRKKRDLNVLFLPREALMVFVKHLSSSGRLSGGPRGRREPRGGRILEAEPVEPKPEENVFCYYFLISSFS